MGLLDILGGGEPGVKVGEQAPEFTLPDADGKPVRLADLRGKPVVLYFYPKDDTPGCTKEACSFRDQYQDFQDAGAVVVGVSSDSSESHRKFAQKYRLPFTLLSDEKKEVIRMFVVNGPLGFWVQRVTFLIDQNRMVKGRVKAHFSIAEHEAFIRDAVAIQRLPG